MDGQRGRHRGPSPPTLSTMTHSRPLAPFLRRVVATLVAVFFAPVAHAQYELQPAYPGLTFVGPLDIQPAIDGTNRMFVVEKRGFIWVFESDYNTTTKIDFLDLTDTVTPKGEGGLLGLAFHPDYASNGYFFVFYVTKTPNRSIIARYHVSSDPNVADDESRVVLLDVPQPDVYHNGGQLTFGEDGYLYIGMGDHRVDATAQDLTDLPGSLLRIDVDADLGPPYPVPPYAIPPDNPFARNNNGYRPEIYAYGFRNPWRFWLDDDRNELLVCDVGEDTYEEINLVGAGRNYGWPLMEGPDCYPDECDTLGMNLRPPLYAYTHSEGSAIVGGRRYRSARLPELADIFVFADYTGGVIWGLHYDGAGTAERFELAQDAPVMLTVGTGFGGDVLMGSANGKVYRLGRASTPVGDTPPRARLLGNFPNPFNPTTTIRFSLDRAAAVRLLIVSVRGEHVRRFDLPRAGAGAHDVVWNGTTDGGSMAASGVYFCRLVVDGNAMGATRLVLVQ